MIFFNRSLEAGGIENPANNIYDVLSTSGDMSTDAGISLTHNTPLTHHAAWKGINLLAGTVGRIPCHVYRLDADRNKMRDSRHPAYQLIRYQPAPELNALNWYQIMMGHVLTRGNHYSYIRRDGSGEPEQIWPLNPDYVTPVMSDNNLWYVYRHPAAGIERKLDYSSILHIKGMGFDGLSGYSLVEHMKNSLGSALAGEKFGNQFFKNGATPAIILMAPGKLNQEQANQIRDHWNGMQTGLSNAHKTAVLQAGVEPKTVSLSPSDSQLIESKKFSLIEFANWLGIPPHKLGDSSRTAYNSLEAENQNFLDEALDVWLVAIEQEFRNKLLTESQKIGETHVIEFQRDALVRANLQAKALYYRQATAGHPWESVNEIRRKQNLPTLGGEYDKLIAPNNNFGSPGNDNARAMARAALDYAIDKMRHRVKKDFHRRLKKHGDPAATMREVKREHYNVIIDNLTPPANVLANLDGIQASEVIEEAATAVFIQEK